MGLRERPGRKIDYVVCCLDGEKRHFPNTVDTECFMCNRKIFHSPDVPDAPRICYKCAPLAALRDSEKGA